MARLRPCSITRIIFASCASRAEATSMLLGDQDSTLYTIQ
jgi:hypothetical protein